MADCVSCSPKWKRPSEIMKMRRKKKSSNMDVRSLSSTFSVLKQKNCDASNEGERKQAKRRNPFGYPSGKSHHESPRKKPNLPTSSNTSSGEESGNSEPDSTKRLFKSLDSSSPFKITPQKSLDMRIFKENHEQAERKSEVLNHNTKPESKSETHTELPVDWSVRSRVRFLSPELFNWCNNLKSTEESIGTSEFVRCQDTQLPENIQDLSSSVETRSQFQRCLMTWMHPSIPWLKLFPRLNGEIKQSSKTSFAVDPDIQASLMSDWSESFHSVFHMLRSKCCPYFYICGCQFTVLFRAAGVGGNPQISALISPTTRGLREALKSEGIDFKMPLSTGSGQSPIHNDENRENRNSVSNQDMNGSITVNHPDEVDSDNEEGCTKTKEQDEDDILEDDSGASSWLQSMGLDKKSFPSLDPHKVKLQRDKTVKVDHRPESLVLVENFNTQALFNFLLNSKSIIAISGPHAGIPPTILSPVAFHGATLKTMKVRHGIIRQHHNGQMKNFGNLDITGPILPHNVSALCRLFEQTQHEGFTATCNVHESSMPFNANVTDKSTVSQDKYSQILQDLGSCGLSSKCLENFTQSNDFGKTAMREIVCKNGLYSWSL